MGAVFINLNIEMAGLEEEAMEQLEVVLDMEVEGEGEGEKESDRTLRALGAL